MRIIVQFQSDEEKATFASKHASKVGTTSKNERPLRLIRELALAPIIVVEVPEDRSDEAHLEDAFRKNEGVVFWEREAQFFLSSSSANDVLNMDAVNSSIFGPFQGDGLAIAIVDGGILATHPDLEQTRIIRKEYIEGKRGLDTGHGTAVAGIICGSGKMSRGRFKGIARGVILQDCVAFDAQGLGRLGDILAAIDDAVNNEIRVICLPFCSRPSTEVSAIFDYYLRVLVEARATIFCCGAGNNGPLHGTIGMPGGYDSVITTGSTSSNFGVSYFSGRGYLGVATAKPDICLPGERVISLNVEGSAWKDTILDENEHYSVISGNSVSVAILAGLVAGILTMKPGAKPSAVRQILVASCTRIRKFAPISTGAGIVSPASIFQNMNLHYAYAKNFRMVAHEAANTTAAVLFFSITLALMIASFM